MNKKSMMVSRRETIKMIRNSKRMMRHQKTPISKERTESRTSLTTTKVKILAKRITTKTTLDRENAISMNKSKPNSKINNRTKTKNSKLNSTLMVPTFFISLPKRLKRKKRKRKSDAKRSRLSKRNRIWRSVKLRTHK